MNIFVFVLLFVFSISISVILFLFLQTRPYFIGRKELENILLKNDDFYATFFPVDLEARHVSSIADYKDKIRSSITEFSFLEKIILVVCMFRADQKLKKIREKYFNGEKAAQDVEWRIGCVEGREYEYGLPHTVGSTIIFTKEMMTDYSWTDLIDTLVHEKVHLYQKRYPEDVDRYLSEKGFVAEKKRSEEDRIRANPDINQTVYKRVYGGIKQNNNNKDDKDNKDKEKDKENKEYRMQYVSRPINITDTIQRDHRKEHPFEEMAIDIELN